MSMRHATAIIMAGLYLSLSGTALAVFSGGDGSEGDPYQVANASDLQLVGSYLTSHFIQTADIDWASTPTPTNTPTPTPTSMPISAAPRRRNRE